MKKTICFYFQIHHSERLRKYHFFDIGKRHDYFDNYVNRSEIQYMAEVCYLPANNTLMKLIEEHQGRFKVAFSISGSAIEQLEMHAPEVIHSFKELAETGCVEFLAETYSHSLSSLSEDTKEFEQEVKKHSQTIKRLFGKKPTTFRNTSLIYSDKIGKRAYDLGFKTVLTDGAKHILGWKSPNFVYSNAELPDQKLLLKNSKLSDDISMRFSDRSWDEYPLTAEKYLSWIKGSLEDTELVNLFMNYDALGRHNHIDSGIFEFIKHFVNKTLEDKNFRFLTPKEVVKSHKPVAPLFVPYPISWSDEERDITSWLGNELQEEAFRQLYAVQEKVSKSKDTDLQSDFSRLQTSDHFYYMRTKLFSDSDYHTYQSPYASPYEAFINYMNVMSDLINRLN